MSSAVFGLVGVLLGSLSTSILTIYKERLTTRREQVARDGQYERDRSTTRDTFQRDSILALQTAVSDLIRAAYQELDRVLAEFNQNGEWTARKWETPTATGWSDAVLRLEMAQARVFDHRLRSLSATLCTLAGQSIWAESLTASKRYSKDIEPEYLYVRRAELGRSRHISICRRHRPQVQRSPLAIGSRGARLALRLAASCPQSRDTIA